MRRATLLLAAIVATCVLAGSAVASGPAPPGRQLVRLHCAGLAPSPVPGLRCQTGKGSGEGKGTGQPPSLPLREVIPSPRGRDCEASLCAGAVSTAAPTTPLDLGDLRAGCAPQTFGGRSDLRGKQLSRRRSRKAL